MESLIAARPYQAACRQRNRERLTGDVRVLARQQCRLGTSSQAVLHRIRSAEKLSDQRQTCQLGTDCLGMSNAPFTAGPTHGEEREGRSPATSKGSSRSAGSPTSRLFCYRTCWRRSRASCTFGKSTSRVTNRTSKSASTLSNDHQLQKAFRSGWSNDGPLIHGRARQLSSGSGPPSAWLLRQQYLVDDVDGAIACGNIRPDDC
jgi:hypothetical protein